MPASRHSSFTDSTDKLIGLWSSSSDHNQPTNTNQTSATATTTTTPRWRWRAAATRWIASNAIETKICFWFFSLFFFCETNIWFRDVFPRHLSIPNCRRTPISRCFGPVFFFSTDAAAETKNRNSVRVSVKPNFFGNQEPGSWELTALISKSRIVQIKLNHWIAA